MGIPNRICPQCGNPLAPSEMYCSNCGTRYMESAEIDPTQRASSSNQGQGPANPSPTPMEPTQYAGSSSSSPYGSSLYSNTAYGSGGQSFSPPPPPNASYTPPYGGVPDAHGQQSPMQPPPGGFVQPPQARKGPNIGLIIGVVVLLLVLVGGGIGIYSFAKSKSSTTNATTPTPVSTQAALFSDNFADNSKGWGLASASGYSGTISNNVMTLADANHKILDMAIPTNTSYSDFEVTTTLTLLKADSNDSAGLYFRGDSNLGQGYFVDIYGDNTYDIVKIFPDSTKDTFLVSPTNSPSINAVGQQNKLAVVAKGSKIVVLINDKVVSSISDNGGYTSGTIELFVENGKSSNGAQASFSSVAVYPAPNQLPG